MPWLSIIMAIVAMLASLKSKPKDKAKAVAAGALAGVGTYLVSHETQWGRENLGSLDGVPPTPLMTVPLLAIPEGDDPSKYKQLPDGSYVLKDSTLLADGSYQPMLPNPTTAPATQITPGLWSTLEKWGPTGTAAVIGTTAVAGSGALSKYLPLLLIGGAILILK